MTAIVKIEHRLWDWLLTQKTLPVLTRGYGALRSYGGYRVYRSRFCPVPASPAHWIAKLLRPGDTYIDVGASYGHMLEIAHAAVGRQGKLYAVEPQREVFVHLQRLMGMLGWHNVQLIQTLIGEEIGEQTFYEAPRSQSSSLSAEFLGNGGIATMYPMTTLNALAEQWRIEQVRLIKIDVEGAEMQVIRGGKDFLQQARPMLLMEITEPEKRIRYFGYSRDDLLGELNMLGYKTLLALRPEGLIPIQTAADFLDNDQDILAIYGTDQTVLG